jgi:glutamine amidotransferase
MTEIVIIDYDIGNIRSIFNAFDKVGVRTKFTRDRDEILVADGVVLPGVGAFAHGMANLKKYSLDSTIKEFSASDKPLLGICLGMQLLLSHSSEFGYTMGLDLIPGAVKPLDLRNPNVHKLPHVNWCSIEPVASGAWDGTILNGINASADMYFVHSFVAVPSESKHILSTSYYSDNLFCSSIKSRNIFGCQFHPEKSADDGLKLIANFAKICGA